LDKLRADCPNYKRSKGKVMNAILSDESDFDESDKLVDKYDNFMDFTAFVGSGSELSFHPTLDHGDSIHDGSNKEVNLQVVYNKLFKECTKLKKFNKLTFNKLNEVEHENEYSIAKLSYLHALVDSLKFENCVLNQKIKSFENDLEMSKV
jgi:hypothetical protein